MQFAKKIEILDPPVSLARFTCCTGLKEWWEAPSSSYSLRSWLAVRTGKKEDIQCITELFPERALPLQRVLDTFPERTTAIANGVHSDLILASTWGLSPQVFPTMFNQTFDVDEVELWVNETLSISKHIGLKVGCWCRKCGDYIPDGKPQNDGMNLCYRCS